MGVVQDSIATAVPDLAGHAGSNRTCKFGLCSHML